MINYVLWLDEVFLSWSDSIIHIIPHFKKPGERWISFFFKSILKVHRYQVLKDVVGSLPPYLFTNVDSRYSNSTEQDVNYNFVSFCSTLDCETSERSIICWISVCNPTTFLWRWIRAAEQERIFRTCKAN